MPTPESVFQTDARRRTTIPKVIPPNETFTIEPLDDGTFRLIPMTMIPSHQLWAWRPEVQEAVEKALQEPGVSLDSPEGQKFMTFWCFFTWSQIMRKRTADQITCL